MKKLFIVTLAATSLIFGALPAVAHSAAPIPMPYRAADPSVQADFMIFVNQHFPPAMRPRGSRHDIRGILRVLSWSGRTAMATSIK
jgi:hypothetical protein